ncbi:MAG: hypothetical protein AAFV53_04815 [Myxococcota bacterium]
MFTTRARIVASLGALIALSACVFEEEGASPPGTCDDTTRTEQCDPDDPGRVVTVNGCGEIIGQTLCGGDLSCEVHSDGTPYCACEKTGALTCLYEDGLSTLYEPSFVIEQRACANPRTEPADVVDTCEFGAMCYADDRVNAGVATCHRSIDDIQMDAPYYDFGCSADAWMPYPTELEIDCRCRTIGDGQGGAGGDGSALADPNNTDVSQGARPGGPVINCMTASQMLSREWPISYGDGPAFYAWFEQSASGASWYSGVIDPASREMYAIMRWTNPDYVDSGTVVAWNVDTGDRRVVSGLHPDRRTGLTAYGSGYESPPPGANTQPQPLSGANTLRWGPDGMLYVYGGGTGESSSNQREIVRVDPNTGARTLVWLAQNDETGDISGDYGQCLRPEAVEGTPRESVQLQAQGFEVGPDGAFYLSQRDVRAGDGVIRISHDGATCTPLSRWGGEGHAPGGGAAMAPPPPPIGAGFNLQFPVRGLLYHDGILFGVSNDQLYAFDPVTGDRTLESYDRGTYGGMGFANMFWDDSRGVAWAVGTIQSHVGSVVDPTTGHVESVFGDSGMEDYGPEQAILMSVYGAERSISGTMLSNGHSINHGAFVLDPDDPNIAYTVVKVGALVKFELSTFNNHVISW